MPRTEGNVKLRLSLGGSLTVQVVAMKAYLARYLCSLATLLMMIRKLGKIKKRQPLSFAA